jgi:hypothetical protein
VVGRPSAGCCATRRAGRLVSDEFTVPLCRGHHREVDRCGDEAAWWKNAGGDPTITARALWLETHPLPTTSDKMGSAPSKLPSGYHATSAPAMRAAISGSRADTGIDD